MYLWINIYHPVDSVYRPHSGACACNNWLIFYDAPTVWIYLLGEIISAHSLASFRKKYSRHTNLLKLIHNCIFLFCVSVVSTIATSLKYDLCFMIDCCAFESVLWQRLSNCKSVRLDILQYYRLLSSFNWDLTLSGFSVALKMHWKLGRDKTSTQMIFLKILNWDFCLTQVWVKINLTEISKIFFPPVFKLCKNSKPEFQFR